MEINNNQKNSSEKKKNLNSKTSDEKGVNNKQTTNSPENNANREVEPKDSFWSKHSAQGWIQIGAILVNIGMLIAFICVATTQHHDSVQAIQETRNSLDFTKKATLSSDKATQRALGISDSSLAIADSSMRISRNIAFIQERIGRIANRAYIVINNNFKTDWPIRVGRIPQVRVSYKNVGKTPAYNIIALETYFFNIPYSWDIAHKFLDFKLPLYFSRYR